MMSQGRSSRYTPWFAVALIVAGMTPQNAVSQVADATPTAALQRQVNDLTWQIGQTFRGRKSEHDRRYDQLAEALEVWNNSARSDADFRVMATWLLDATRASMPGANTDMPALPKFASIVSPTRPTIAATNNPAVEQLPAGQSTRSAFGQSPAEELPPQRTQPRQQTQPSIESPPIAVAPFTPPPAELPAPVEDPIEWPADDPVDLFEPQQPAESSQAAQTTPVPPSQPSAPEPVAEPPTPRHPASAALAWGNPFVDDPQPVQQAEEERFTDRPEANLAAVESGRRTARFRPSGRFDSTVKVNLSELSAQARGYARGVEFIEAEMIATPHPTAFRLAGLARELESLQAQRHMLELYLTGLEEIERMTIEDLPSPAEAIRLISQRADQRREELASANSPASDAELAILAGLERKLAELSIASGR